MINGTKLIDKSFKTREEAEYILDLYELCYKPYCPHYNILKEIYKDIYDDLIKYGAKKYIELNNIKQQEVNSHVKTD